MQRKQGIYQKLLQSRVSYPNAENSLGPSSVYPVCAHENPAYLSLLTSHLPVPECGLIPLQPFPEFSSPMPTHLHWMVPEVFMELGGWLGLLMSCYLGHYQGHDQNKPSSYAGRGHYPRLLGPSVALTHSHLFSIH